MKTSWLAGVVLAMFLLGGWPGLFAAELGGAGSAKGPERLSGWDGSAFPSLQAARIRVRPARVRVGGGRGGGGLFGITIYVTVEATSHATFGSTSNWMFSDDMAGNRRQLAPFVFANYDRIGQEMAEGRGEHVGIVAGLLGCPASLRGEFALWTRANYGLLFPDARDDPERLIRLLTRGSAGRAPLGGRCRTAG